VAAGFDRHGMPPAASNDTGTALGPHSSDQSRDLATLNFDLGGHGACGWCGSSSSIRVPSLKFVSLAIWKIWCTMSVSINGPGDPDLWPFDLETGMRITSKAGKLRFKFRHDRPLGSRIIRYVCDGPSDSQSDKQTDGQKLCLLPHSLWAHVDMINGPLPPSLAVTCCLKVYSGQKNELAKTIFAV